ncbi:D-glycero-beta-D-manno-heptose-1,7-bisphosphate 7-phosphatase, partial [Bacillus cereus]
ETNICAGKKAGIKTIRIASHLEETKANLEIFALLNVTREHIF